MRRVSAHTPFLSMFPCAMPPRLLTRHAQRAQARLPRLRGVKPRYELDADLLDVLDALDALSECMDKSTPEFLDVVDCAIRAVAAKRQSCPSLYVWGRNALVDMLRAFDRQIVPTEVETGYGITHCFFPGVVLSPDPPGLAGRMHLRYDKVHETHPDLYRAALLTDCAQARALLAARRRA